MSKRWLGILVTWIGLLPGPALAAEGMSGAGTVTGTVTLDGRATSDVVVSVTGAEREMLKAERVESQPERATVDQRGMNFIPRVSAVRAGTLVSFPNSDKTWHNVYSASETKSFDLGLYPPGESRGVTMDKPGVVRILCNVHPTMEAFVIVLDHPFFAVPNERGVYRIPSLPVGEYRLEVWHPVAGAKRELFKISRAGEVRVMDVGLTPPR
jgi:plastocyanin